MRQHEQQQQHATPQSATDTTDTTDTAASPVVIDQMSALAAIDGLIEALAARDTASIEDAGDYEGFATTAVGLARLATAWHGYHAGVRQPAGRTVLPPASSVDELRASLNILLSDPNMTDHGVTLSCESVQGFVWGLRQAVTTCDVPSEEEQDEEAGRAFQRLGWLALSLHEAASAAGALIFQRVHDLKRARGEYPYGQGYTSPYRAVDGSLVAAVGKAIKGARVREQGHVADAGEPRVMEGDATGAPEADADRERRA